MAESFWQDDHDPWAPLTARERQNALSATLPFAENLANLQVLHARNRPDLFPPGGCTPGTFALGSVKALDRPLVGIIGTRAAGPYGREVATHFARSLAKAGATVVSGGAMGIDVAAHTGAMAAGGQTVAVLPCGADVDYPTRHRDVFAQIRSEGCVLSRFPLGGGLREHWLPLRNRLVAQVCRALVIVEAPAGSGALMTAAFARESGVPLFVVPGPVTGTGFKGSHALIRSGAVLTDDPGQVVESLGIESADLRGHAADYGSTESRVMDAVGGVPRSAESIGEETGLSVPEVLSALTLLEIEGAVFKSVEGYARRA